MVMSRIFTAADLILVLCVFSAEGLTLIFMPLIHCPQVVKASIPVIILYRSESLLVGLFKTELKPLRVNLSWIMLSILIAEIRICKQWGWWAILTEN
jgi:hypothetical protein